MSQAEHENEMMEQMEQELARVNPHLASAIERRMSSLQNWIIGGGVFVLVLTITLVIFVAWATASQFRGQQEILLQGQEAHDGLCALKTDIERRRDALVLYMREHPGPEPIKGISRADLQRSLDARNETIVALRTVRCAD